MKKLVLETTSPFQGLPELVAYDEGLFEKEGVEIEWADRDEAGIKTADTSLTDVKGADPFVSHGTLLEAGQGRHVQRLRMGQLLPRRRHQGRQPAGRPPRHRHLRGDRGAAGFAGLHAAAACRPHASACRSMPAPTISRCTCWKVSCRATRSTCAARPTGSRNRFNLMMKGEIEATTLTEPYITLAEKKGCRVICSAFYHGTEVASDRVDAETYAAFNRAVREAVRRINANKQAYLRYFIDYHKKRDPEIGTLKPEDLRARPHRRGRSGADPGRRAAAHLRLGEELGHAGRDRVAARSSST